jgi:hypothetical protein
MSHLSRSRRLKRQRLLSLSQRPLTLRLRRHREGEWERLLAARAAVPAGPHCECSWKSCAPPAAALAVAPAAVATTLWADADPQSMWVTAPVSRTIAILRSNSRSGTEHACASHSIGTGSGGGGGGVSISMSFRASLAAGRTCAPRV